MSQLRKPVRDFKHVVKHVVFFHGLNGSYDTTFLSSGEPPEVWPNWLNDLGDEIAVWGLDYEATGTRWQDGHSMELPDRALNILPLLASAPELSKGDVILIGYSLGGLVAKHVLRLAEDERGNDARIGNFIRRVRKVGFIATPHFGSDHATLAKNLAQLLRPRESTAGLGRNDSHLRELNHWYRTFSEKNQIQNLVLYETKSIRLRWPVLGRRGFSLNIGTIVKPDSSDPGLPQPVRVIPIDADHWSIVHPIDRNAEVFVHIRDFVSAPTVGIHADTYLGERLEAMSTAIQNQGSVAADMRGEIVEVLGNLSALSSEQAAAVAAGTENPVATAELTRRVTRLRKLRCTLDLDAAQETRALFEELRNGALAVATRSSKRLAAAWCARVISSKDVAFAETMLSAANSFGLGEENDIAAAFIQLHRDHDKSGALMQLATLNSPLARSASVSVAGHGVSSAEMLSWLDSSGLTLNDVDPDGKFLILQRRLETGQWFKALTEADTLTNVDFGACPVLLICAGSIHLSAAIHDDLKSSAVFHLPLDLAGFPLATDGPSLDRRRRAKELFERAAAAFAELSADGVVGVAEDYALWLGLRDSSTHNDALRSLQESMSGAPRSLRRVPFALQFGLRLEFEEVERQIDQQMALTGGKSPEAAIARFALAQAKKDPLDVASYIDRHRDQLIIYFQPDWIDAVQVEALARSGQTSEARTKLADLQSRLSDTEVQKLQRIIDEEGSADQISLREVQYASSKALADLIILVDMLRAKKAWPKLAVFGATLFDSTKDVSSLRTYVEALYRTGDHARVIGLASTYGEMFATGGLLNTLAWSNLRVGDLDAAKMLLGRLGASPENPKDTWLAINIAVTTGDWNSLSSIAEEEWSHRSERGAQNLLRMGQLAALAGSGRSKDLIKEAAKMADGDPSILVACYSEATNAGWEDDPDVHQWLDRAIKSSGTDGPIQRVDLKQLLDRQPSWNERENHIWAELSSGRFPTFAAGLVLRRSLLHMYLIPALSNLEQSDPRRRPFVFAFSGARRLQSISVRRVAVDATALLTLSFLGLLRVVRDHFEKIVISPNMLGWLLEERRKVQFHQPSRVRAALEVTRLLNNGSLKRFEPAGGVKPELEREVGADLALMLAAAGDEVEGDQRQRVVIRPYPLHRAGTLMDKIADVGGYESHLAGCIDLVSALKRLGHVTAAEEERFSTYLSINEKPWPHSPIIQDGAVLFLDGLAVTYLQHLKLLDRLKAAGFTAFVSVLDLAEGDALLNHEAFAEAAQAVVEDVRSALAEGVVAEKIEFGAFPPESEVDVALNDHPSTHFFDLAPLVDGFIVDDRALNFYSIIKASDGPKGNFSTLDVLLTLRDVGKLTNSELGEHLTTLRRAGFIFVPILGDELKGWLNAATIVDGRIVETAELRAIRESILRARMTDILQLPQEHVWLDGINLTLLRTIRSFWTDGMDEAATRARSNWLLSLFDIRKWAHRTQPETGTPQQKYAAQLLVLTTFVDASDDTRNRYWQWLQDALLTKLHEDNDESYLELVRHVEEGVAKIVADTMKDGADK